MISSYLINIFSVSSNVLVKNWCYNVIIIFNIRVVLIKNLSWVLKIKVNISEGLRNFLKYKEISVIGDKVLKINLCCILIKEIRNMLLIGVNSFFENGINVLLISLNISLRIVFFLFLIVNNKNESFIFVKRYFED